MLPVDGFVCLFPLSYVLSFVPLFWSASNRRRHTEHCRIQRGYNRRRHIESRIKNKDVYVKHKVIIWRIQLCISYQSHPDIVINMCSPETLLFSNNRCFTTQHSQVNSFFCRWEKKSQYRQNVFNVHVYQLQHLNLKLFSPELFKSANFGQCIS